MHTRNGGFCRDDGFAMVFVMGAVAVITVIAISGYVIASQSLSDSLRNTSEHRAYQAASTGLDQELSWFKPQDMSRYPVNVALGTHGDTYRAEVVQRGEGVYDLLCVGRSDEASETVFVRFKYMNLWDMNISGGEGSGVGSKNAFNGSSWIYGSLYVNGDIDWSASGALYEGPLFLKDGTWTASGSGAVGTASSPVDGYGPIPTTMKDYYVNLVGSAPDLEIPTISNENMADWLVMAQYTAKSPRIGTKHANGDDINYTVWTGPSTIGDVDFGNKLSDPIAYEYDTVTNQGVLYINQVDTNNDGTRDTDPVIYCDNTISFTNQVTRYQGRGIIVARDGFNMDGSLVPLAGLVETLGPPKNSRTVPRMDAANCLGLLSQGGMNVTTSAALGSFPTGGLCAAIFLNESMIAGGSSHLDFRGSLICNSIELASTNVVLATQPGLYKSLPKGMPELSGFTARGDWVRR